MSILLYFILGACNVILLHLIAKIYKVKTGIDVFPVRKENDYIDSDITILSYFISGPFGTVMLGFISVYLYFIWRKYYKK